MFGYDMDKIDVIKKNIEFSLHKYNINFLIEIQNYGKCIAVSGFDMYIWIRLLPSREDGKYIVEFSSVQMPTNSRRQGMFTSIFNRLKNCKYVDTIRITGVCSSAMFNWCQKNKLTQNSFGDFYTRY